VEELPLDTRNIVALVTLGPGAIPRQLGGFTHDVINDVQQGSRGSVAFNPPINGSRSTMNAFVLDGAYDTDRNTFAIAVYPPLESVEELRVQSSGASAEFPQAGGAAIDVVTRSGSGISMEACSSICKTKQRTRAVILTIPPWPRRRCARINSADRWAVRLPCEHVLFRYVRRAAVEDRQPGAEPGPARAATRRATSTGQDIIYDPLTLDATGARVPFPGEHDSRNADRPYRRQFS
jgi:hypothetical protein